MGENITHRGPDEQGHYLDEHFAVVHRRLSIIDLAAGQQPMLSDDEQVVLAFNGEIFNFIELRTDLLAQGVLFHTQSDTEVVLQLYLKYGHNFVSMLNGQFAISIWDKRSKTCLLIRDRVGICPLFYTQENGQLIFGSEVKAIKPALANGLNISTKALDHIFTFWAPLAPHTIFENIYEVQPGMMLIVNEQGVESRPYWEWSYSEPLRQESEGALIEELHDLLVDATKIRLRSDVPVGAYLSGGLDSSSIVALIHRHGNIPMRTFSLNFDQKNFDEQQFQSDLTRHLKTEHSQILVKPDDIVSAFESTIYHTEAPILRTAPVPMGILSGLVRENGFKVVLTGEGADEVLGGYDIFKEAKVRRFWAQKPESEWRPLLLKRLYPYLTLPEGRKSIYLKSFFGQSLDNPELSYFSHLPRWTTTAKAKLFFSDDLSSELSGQAYKDLEAFLPDQIANFHPFNRSQYIESKTLMSGYLLNSQGDRMLMKHSVEGRFPFLDHRLIEFANRLPPKLKMKGMNEKYALKKAMSPYLPASIVSRSKQPYRAPDVNTGENGLVNSDLVDYLSDSHLQRSGLFNPKKVAMLLTKARKGRALSTSESQALTGILSTQIVYDKFVSH
jgi:asparagine synthase (glutamine-hydrolysing)